MAASDSTIQQILKVLARHMPSQQATRVLIIDLRNSVRGNKSVMMTLAKLEEATR